MANKKIRVDYIKWLRKKLKIKQLQDFIQLIMKYFTKIMVLDCCTQDIKTGEGFTILGLLKESYPNYKWNFGYLMKPQIMYGKT